MAGSFSMRISFEPPGSQRPSPETDSIFLARGDFRTIWPEGTEISPRSLTTTFRPGPALACSSKSTCIHITNLPVVPLKMVLNPALNDIKTFAAVFAPSVPAGNSASCACEPGQVNWRFQPKAPGLAATLAGRLAPDHPLDTDECLGAQNPFLGYSCGRVVFSWAISFSAFSSFACNAAELARLASNWVWSLAAPALVLSTRLLS